MAVAYLLGPVEPACGTRKANKLARAVSWPQPLRYCHIQPDPTGLEINVGLEVAGKREVTVKTDVPVKGLVLEASVPEPTRSDRGVDAREEVFFCDNGFDIVPGEIVTVMMENYVGGGVTAWWLNKSLSCETTGDVPPSHQSDPMESNSPQTVPMKA